MNEDFDVTYEIDDGYCGSAPHHFQIDSSCIDPYMSEDELRELLHVSVQQDFEQNISPVCDQESEFIIWAKEHQERMREEIKADD